MFGAPSGMTWRHMTSPRDIILSAYGRIKSYAHSRACADRTHATTHSLSVYRFHSRCAGVVQVTQRHILTMTDCYHHYLLLHLQLPLTPFSAILWNLIPFVRECKCRHFQCIGLRYLCTLVAILHLSHHWQFSSCNPK